MFLIGDLPRFSPLLQGLLRYAPLLALVQTLLGTSEFEYHYANATIYRTERRRGVSARNDASRARLTVTDAVGTIVANLADGLLPPGEYRASLDASRLAPGLYFCVLEAAAERIARRLVVVR